HWTRPLAELEERTRIARRALLHHLGEILVELLQRVGEADVDRVDGEAAAEHPLFERMPGRPEARLKIAQAAVAERARGMDDGAGLAGQRVDGGGAEVAFLSVRGVERAFGGPAQAQVERDGLRQLPVVLEVEAVDGVPRQP